MIFFSDLGKTPASAAHYIYMNLGKSFSFFWAWVSSYTKEDQSVLSAQLNPYDIKRIKQNGRCGDLLCTETCTTNVMIFLL